MRTLVIDTATKACSVALFHGQSLLAASYDVIGRGHAEHLLPLIAALPERGRADQIMVDVGPGSFTGIRIGVAAAKALGLAWEVPVNGYGCLSLVAAMALEKCPDATAVDIVMTGGHGEYFFGSFNATASSISPTISIKPDAISAKSRAPLISGDFDPKILGKSWIDLLPDAKKWHLITDLPMLMPTPVYGRAPDAKPLMVPA
ncbi:tRNA (adenosine(37)-N6)-threonylcarbamoyltransferase complex dimerization subunit type 1 TsaB [Sphingorhabdus sp. IMCC26285]|uniref:tRNA (Adenosine(37)-N6)-threonylcarbamoyltransferase complex dimerization subunit type 1 TsaB n=1 Tax=Sphingorhabdus profundilacus TaxID=2509718 RepID=A0A6I4LYB4_9SPHN|nr:tRNA (adenosine(37)-N6)-threonylcarbamoyltransferase complex dimerization subunit type 1 TsaB [Sphingorhabdus profundilacus]MVZ97056.1 tRNA (adenosine(37)-N6)-threonylcarbamoyltransferase complex dimerization subunit type 1 TsaB [Sphingorhabdus profundilacus]